MNSGWRLRPIIGKKPKLCRCVHACVRQRNPLSYPEIFLILVQLSLEIHFSRGKIVNTPLFQYLGLGMSLPFPYQSFCVLGKLSSHILTHVRFLSFCVLGLLTNQIKTSKTHLEGPETAVYYGHKKRFKLRCFYIR